MTDGAIVRIDATDQELTSGELSLEHLQAACAAMRQDGTVVLGGVVQREHLEALRERMMTDLEVVLARPDRPDNFLPGNVQQDPPPFPPYLFEDVLANPLAAAVSRALMGPGVHNDFYSGNTNLPGSPAQPVHVDEGQLWADMPEAHPCSGVIVQICLVDTDERNGSIELWPGTHRDTAMHRGRETLRVPPERVEARRATNPPVRGCTRLGDILLRDVRIWHRGMPNHSDRPRHMLAMFHRPNWFQRTPVPFRRDAQPFLAGLGLPTTATFHDEVDYLHHWGPFDVQGGAGPGNPVGMPGAEVLTSNRYPHET
jgi:hypothetical protein